MLTTLIPVTITLYAPPFFPSDGDQGRGSATLSSRGPLDREDPGPLRLVPLVVGDAGGLTRTASLTVLIGDRNDNPARPGTKTVHVTRLKARPASKLDASFPYFITYRTISLFINEIISYEYVSFLSSTFSIYPPVRCYIKFSPI